MSYRVVKELEWARPCPRPSRIPVSRPKGVKAEGLRYEKALAKALPEACHGQWFEFEDKNGPGWCQTDLILDLGQSLVVVEAKLRWVPEAWGQIHRLYLPVVEKALGKPVVGVVVCKVLVKDLPSGVRVFRDLGKAVLWAAGGGSAVMHWIGEGPVWTTEAKSEALGPEF